jgi:DNA-binding protein
MNTTAFQQLFDGFRQAANLPDLASQSMPSGLTSFLVTIQDVDIQVSHLGEPFAYIFIDADLGAHDDFDTTLAAELAEANAWLLTHEHGAVICKRPITRDYVVRTAVALDQEASATALKQRVQSQASAVAAIRRNFLASAPVKTAPIASANLA